MPDVLREKRLSWSWSYSCWIYNYLSTYSISAYHH